MTDLIAKLEQAAEGSRELDAAIAGLKSVSVAILMDEDRSHPGPHYTTSLDDSVALVPEGLAWLVEGAHGTFSASIHPEYAQWGDPIYAATPALALTIAALKAREAG